jgi:CRISPR-associated protein Csd2
VTGFSEDDLELLWTAILNMFEFDRSAARGKMTLRELIIFKHDDALGNAPSHKLFDLIEVRRNEGVTVPRSYGDYVVEVGDAPEGVTIIRRS